MKKQKEICKDKKIKATFIVLGFLLALLLAYSYFLVPHFWDDKEHLLTMCSAGSFWLLYNGGIRPGGKEDEKT